MDVKEANKRIEDHMIVHRMYEDNAIKITEALMMAIDAMEKQVPKKPIRESQCSSNAFNGWYLWHCPICHNQLGVVNRPRKDSYCEKCGQKLDWSYDESYRNR